jgi:hypothetical protein
VNVSPVADENLAVYSCSSDRIALVLFYISYIIPVLPNLVVDPDLAEGANLIYFPPFYGLPTLLVGELRFDSFKALYLASYSS